MGNPPGSRSQGWVSLMCLGIYSCRTVCVVRRVSDKRLSCWAPSKDFGGLCTCDLCSAERYALCVAFLTSSLHFTLPLGMFEGSTRRAWRAVLHMLAGVHYYKARSTLPFGLFCREHTTGLASCAPHASRRTLLQSTRYLMFQIILKTAHDGPGELCSTC